MKPFTLVVALVSAFVLSANAGDTFKVDPVHTFVLFSVQHLGIANTYGRFNDISGTVVFDKDNPSQGKRQRGQIQIFNISGRVTFHTG